VKDVLNNGFTLDWFVKNSIDDQIGKVYWAASELEFVVPEVIINGGSDLTICEGNVERNILDLNTENISCNLLAGYTYYIHIVLGSGGGLNGGYASQGSQVVEIPCKLYI
jgi:hypothetical protein